jgi:hypothetical protein
MVQGPKEPTEPTATDPLISKGHTSCSSCAYRARALTVVYPDRTLIVVHCLKCGIQSLYDASERK